MVLGLSLVLRFATGSYVMGFIGSAILAAVAVLLVVVAKKLANKMLNA